MQIDFHHTVTYILARYAGFEHKEAEKIAYAAQYVDDATNEGTIEFKNGAMYTRIASAHKMLDYKNFNELANHHVWLPFHFLPGNGGLEAGKNPTGSFINKIVCKPNSFIAKEMIAECIDKQDLPYGLHRLGITMHVYADTWAHQGFAGCIHEINSISDIDADDCSEKDFLDNLKSFFQESFDEKQSQFISDTIPLGHGAVLTCPDRPYLSWSFVREENKIERNNTELFIEAANEMYKTMKRYRKKDAQAFVENLSEERKELLEQILKDTTYEEPERRHKVWLGYIRNGHFDFGKANLEYKAKGKDSWKHSAIGTRRKKDKSGEKFEYDASFLTSDWKLFHDALQAHRFYIIHDLLPKYGICAA